MNHNVVRVLRTACLCVAATVQATSIRAGEILVADVPFAFQVNTRNFPAGEYRISLDGTHTVMMLRSVDSGRSVFSLAYDTGNTRRRSVPGLIFKRYGDRCFLSQFWSANGERVLPKGPQERELARGSLKPRIETVAYVRR